MAATDSLTSVPFPADLTAPSCWDPHVPSVPYSSSITLPDTDNIIAELSMIESAISTPVPSDTTPLPPTPPPLLTTPATNNKRPAPQQQQRSSKKLKLSSSSSSTCAPSQQQQHVQSKPEMALFVSSPLTSPVSPTGSLCSDDAVDDRPMLTTHNNNQYQQYQQHQQEQQRTHQPHAAAATPPLSPAPSLSPANHSQQQYTHQLVATYPSSAMDDPLNSHQQLPPQSRQSTVACAPQQHQQQPQQVTQLPTSPLSSDQPSRSSPAVSVPTPASRPLAAPLPPQASSSSMPAAAAFTREHTKQRRALRRAALNRARDRRALAHCAAVASATHVKTEPSTLLAGGAPSPDSPSLSCSQLSAGSAPNSPRRSSAGLSLDGGRRRGGTNTQTPAGSAAGRFGSGAQCEDLPGASNASLGSSSTVAGGCSTTTTATNATTASTATTATATTAATSCGTVGKREAEMMVSSGQPPVMGAAVGEHVDKKAARAIRNREAAMKSRIEAKQKMRKLQDENHSLAVKVKSLSQENEALTTQLKSLLSTLGVTVSEGQDVKSVMGMLTRMAQGARNASLSGSAAAQAPAVATTATTNVAPSQPASGMAATSTLV